MVDLFWFFIYEPFLYCPWTDTFQFKKLYISRTKTLSNDRLGSVINHFLMCKLSRNNPYSEVETDFGRYRGSF